jgi:hypothetical protein
VRSLWHPYPINHYLHHMDADGLWTDHIATGGRFYGYLYKIHVWEEEIRLSRL